MESQGSRLKNLDAQSAFAIAGESFIFKTDYLWRYVHFEHPIIEGINQKLDEVKRGILNPIIVEPLMVIEWTQVKILVNSGGLDFNPSQGPALLVAAFLDSCSFVSIHIPKGSKNLINVDDEHKTDDQINSIEKGLRIALR